MTPFHHFQSLLIEYTEDRALVLKNYSEVFALWVAGYALVEVAHFIAPSSCPFVDPFKYKDSPQ